MNAPMIIGRQTFDGLGRQLTVQAGASITQYHYTEGQIPPAANTLSDGKRVSFTYEKALNNQLLGIAAEGEATTQINHHPTHGQPSLIEGALGTQTFDFTANGQPATDRWNVDENVHTTTWRYSFAGLLQGFDDAQGAAHRRHLDRFGRVEKTSIDATDTTYTYDALSRPITLSVSDPDGKTLTTSITYDDAGREHTRTFTVIPPGTPEDDAGGQHTLRTFTQTLEYSALDQITTRHWNDGSQRGTETFEYDVRDRLVRYTANAFAAPQDPYGNRIVEQFFTFNALNGYEKVISHFADGSSDEARFSYASDDPARVVKITHSHASWPAHISLTHDACGRVTHDSLGRNMQWDTQGRLTELRTPTGTCQYRYDPSGRLTDRVLNGSLTRDHYSADQLTHKQTGHGHIQLIGDMDALFGLSKVTDGVRRYMLVGSDAQASTRVEVGESIRTRRYTAHGADISYLDSSPFGYTGEQREPLSGWYLPGGHRPYDPVLMCFLAPDSDSPFGPGGINPYAWCGGDPVNRVDPDGHSWVSYALAGLGIALGAVALIPGLQAALPAAGALFHAGAGALTTAQITALAVATLDIVSLATGIASTALEATGQDGAATGILGGISLVTGFSGAGLGAKLRGLRQASARQRALDIERGWTGPQVKRLGRSTEFLKDSSGTVHVGLIETYQGTDHAALLTHGDPLRALLMGPDGKVTRAADLARDFIAPQLKSVDQTGHSFVLLSCWGAKNGAAVEVARELGRPVQAFSQKTFVKGFANLQTSRSAANIPTETVPFLERLRATRNPFTAWKTAYREARPTFFFPDGTTIKL